jgi:hypothetical protein
VAKSLVVVLGAGASFDCASDAVAKNVDLQAPLVTQLFDKRFQEVLHAYPLAEQVAPDIRVAVESGQVALEKYLLEELRESSHDHLRRRYQAVPLYLQHLFYEISRGYTKHPDNYDRLITEALRLDRVTFVTLNYDILLDERLAIDQAIDSLRDYVDPRRRWSLVKLHGSINWGRRVYRATLEDDGILALGFQRAPRTFAGDFAVLGEDIQTDPEIELRSGDLEEMRAEWRVDDTASASFVGVGRRRLGDLYFPALAAPLGEADEIVCPRDHVSHVATQLATMPALNLLVIGYSGIDQEVLGLIKSAGKPVRSLKVVNGTFDASYATLNVLSSALSFVPAVEMAFNGGFNDFAQTDAMSSFLRGLPDT